jgi:cell wall-associated NlpC family hydrolase
MTSTERVELRFDGVSRGATKAAHDTRTALRQVGDESDRTSKRASKGFRESQKDLDRFSRGAIAGSGAFRSFGRSIAFASASFLGGVGFIAIVRQSISRASDLHEELNKVDVVFRDSARSVKAWSKDSAFGFGLARSEALKFAGTFGNLLTPMGIAPDLAATMSKRLVELAGDMASFNNASPEEVLLALNSGLTGMVRPLRRYGVFLDQDRIAAEALRLGVVKANVDMSKTGDAATKVEIATAKLTVARKKYGEGTTQVAAAEVALHSAERALSAELGGRVPKLTAAQKAQATYAIILKDTANAQGDFARTSDGLANQQRILRAELINIQEEIGTALMPTILRLTRGLTGYLQTLESGGSRHEAFIKLVHQVGDVLRSVYGVVRTFATGLNTVARVMGGWGNAFSLVLSLFLAKKFIALAAAIRNTRIAMFLLGQQAAASGTAQTWAAFGTGGSIARKVDGSTGRVVALRSALRSLATLGLITIAIELLIHRKLVGDVLESIVGDTPATGIPTAGQKSAQDWARYLKAHGYSRQGAHTRMVQVAIFSEQEITAALDKVYGTTGAKGGTPGEPVVTGPRQSGKRDQAAFIAVTAARSPGAGGTGFHLPGERKPYDCSAFVQAVYAHAGITIGSNTYEQVKQGRHVDRSQLRPGDLIFMNFPGERSPGHVGIYVGGGQMVHDHGASGGVEAQAVPWNAVVDTRTYAAGKGNPAIVAPADPGAGAGGDGGLTVGATPKARKKTDKPDPEELQAARRTAAFVERAVGRVVSPTLRKNLRKRADELNEALQHVANEGELRKLQKRLDSLTHDLEEAVKLGQATTIARKSAAALATQISRLPEALAKDVRAKMKVVQKELADVTTAGQLARVRKQMDAIAKAIADAIDKLRMIVGQRQDAFGTAFGRVADKMLSIFDAQTQKLIDRARARVAEFGFEIGVGEETPAERRQRERDAVKTAEDMAKRLADAQAAVSKAAAELQHPDFFDSRTNDERAQALIDAQKDLQDALYDAETAGLEKQAEAERKAADAALAAEQKRIQDERDLLRERFQNRISEIETNLANETITAKEARDQLLALMADPAYQTSFGDIGDLMGAAFATGFSDAIDGLTTALNALIDALNELLKATGKTPVRHAEPATRSPGRPRSPIGHPAMARGGTVPGQYVGRSDTIVGHLTPGEEVIERSTATALRRFLAQQGSGGGGSSYGPIYVLGTTPREVAAALAKLTGPELDRQIGYRLD